MSTRFLLSQAAVFSVVLSVCLTNLSADELATAEKLYRAGKWAEARDVYESLVTGLEGEPRATALIRVGYCWQRLHKHDRAIAVFRRVLRHDDVPDEQVCLARVRLGYSLRLAQKSVEAVKVLDRAAAMEGVPPNLTAEALLFAAWELNTKDRPDEALQRFARVEQIEGVHQNYIATALLAAGRVHQDREQYKDAIAAYRKIETLTPVAAVNRARARVYILECESLLAGDQEFHIRPYVTHVTQAEAQLLWVSQGEVPQSTVEIREATAELEQPGKLAQSLGPDAVDLTPLKRTICHRHSARLAGLRPGTRYRYTVRCGEQTANGSFVTARGTAEPFSFCLIGDTQSYHPGLQPLLDAMGEEQTDFTLHVGDVTDRGQLWGEWKASFFDPGRPYLKHSAFWPVYGNHDGGPYFPALFQLGRHLYYSFDWGDAHFVVLDSYGAGTGTVGRPKQLKWLEEDLKQNTKTWTFAAMHVPMIATRSGIKSFGTDDFLPLLEKYGVDVVFSGHHPLYRRYHPLGSQGQKPILHVTSGGGGGPIGGYMPSPLLARGIAVNHYCRIDVGQDRLTLTAKSISGAVIDRFELRKTDGRFQDEVASAAVETKDARRVISLYQELLTDRTFELRLETRSIPQPQKTATLLLDLNRLPRGPLDRNRFPNDVRLEIASVDESQWKVGQASFLLDQPIIRLKAVAPAEVSAAKGDVTPVARLRIRLKTADREFEPYDAVARIRVAPAR